MYFSILFVSCASKTNTMQTLESLELRLESVKTALKNLDKVLENINNGIFFVYLDSTTPRRAGSVEYPFQPDSREKLRLFLYNEVLRDKVELEKILEDFERQYLMVKSIHEPIENFINNFNSSNNEQ